MNVGFVTPSISRAAGGIFEIERRLGQCLALLPGTTVQVYGLRDQFSSEDEQLWLPLKPETFPVRGPHAFGYAPAILDAMERGNLDVAHLHALWMFTSVSVNRWARLHRRPYLVTLNGMIDPWALRNSRWKKQLALWLYERRCLNEAGCLQVNSEAEFKSAREFGLKNPVAIIPNGVDLPELVPVSTSRVDGGSANPTSAIHQSKLGGRRVLLYLGRIHPKKGLMNLLKAWAKVARSQSPDFCPPSSDWVLAIAGWDQGGHEAELKRLATELGIHFADVRNPDHQPATINDQPSIIFLGPQFNEAKAAWLAGCDAFILPSFSEGLPMAVLEAWSYGKPVLMTPECNLPQGYLAHAAFRIEASSEGIANMLGELFTMSPSALRALGDNGRALVAASFTWAKVAVQMKSVYDWLLGGGPKPDCVLPVWSRA